MGKYNRRKKHLDILKNYKLYFLFLPGAVILILFNYIPMLGNVLAIKDFIPKYGIWGSPFVQPWNKYFVKLFADEYFWRATKNTLIISLLRLVFVFPAPIILAMLYNELKVRWFKRISQTVLYLPHFLSWVIVAGIIKQLFLKDGFVNTLLLSIGGREIDFLTEGRNFLVLLILSDIWKGIGFGSIIYLAAIAGIDTTQYEAARLDGAGRLQTIWYITLPGIRSAISVQLILSLSGILNGGFDQIYNLYSVPVYDVADIIDTYVYRIGITQGQVSLATALGLFKSVIALVLVLISNKLSKKIGGYGLW